MNDLISRNDFLKKLALGGMGTILGGAISEAQSTIPIQTEDPSSFPVQGFHIDLRVEVMTLKALRSLALKLSHFGINALIVEYEASYPYQKQATISNQYAYDRSELEDWIDYCKNLGIEVIPLQECLGHVQYILRHDRYAGLRIEHSILSQLDPLNKDAIPLFTNLIEDLVSLHPSKYIHVGGDETRHLDHQKFSNFIQRNGVSKLYTQYMKRICQIAIDNGKTPLLWADMILKYPDAVEDLPIDQIIFIDWNYGWDINKFGQIKVLQKKGCTFWGAPALRSSPDNYFITRWKKHFDNLRDFIPYARKAHYSGMIMTSWSTSGIYNYQWEGGSGALLKMFPQRNVYPLAGFDVLIAAYSKALKTRNPIDSEQFVIDYAQEQFSLSAAEANVLWNYLAHKQVLVKNGKSLTEKRIGAVLREFRKVRTSLDQLEATENREEFEHFKLMAAIREFYLSVRQIEAMAESVEFNRSKTMGIKERLKPLLEVSEKLDKRFIALNGGYLHDTELERLNHLRNQRLRKLWNIYGA